MSAEPRVEIIAAHLRAIFDGAGRPEQHDFAQCVAAMFDAPDPRPDQPGRVVAIQADTGTGKTRAYLAAAALCTTLTGERIVIATHSHALMRQILDKELAVVRDMLARQSLPNAFTVAVRLGRRNFVSLKRLDALAGTNALLEPWLRYAQDPRSSGTFAEAHDEWGLVLPPGLTTDDVCLTAGEASPHFGEHQRAAVEADIVVTTHAMLLADARRWGRVLTASSARRLAIIDEADALVHAAEQEGIARVGFGSLLALADRAGGITRVRAIVSDLRKMADELPVAAGSAALESVALLQAWLSSLDLAEDDADERDQLLSDLGEWLDNVGAREAASIVERGSLATACLDSGRVVSRLWSAGASRPAFLRGVALVSATLGAGDGNDFAEMLQRIGVFSNTANFDAQASRSISMGDFGQMRFVLADRKVPLPFAAADPDAETEGDGWGGPSHGRERSAEWVAYVVAGIQAAHAEGGRALVLCASYDDVDLFADALPGAMAQRRGDRLADCVAAFEASPDSILLTPAAWAGLDLPHTIAHVLIPRIPFAPIDDAVDAVWKQIARAKGWNGASMRGMLVQRNRADAVRRLRQGMGRGIRVEDDDVKVWILDPRFPIPTTITRDLRRRLTQGFAAGHAALKQAIPLRFRVGVDSAFESAEILPWVGTVGSVK